MGAMPTDSAAPELCIDRTVTPCTPIPSLSPLAPSIDRGRHVASVPSSFSSH